MTLQRSLVFVCALLGLPAAAQAQTNSAYVGKPLANAVFLTKRKPNPDKPRTLDEALADVPTSGRNVSVGGCSVNPNRVFTDAGVAAAKKGCARAAAVDAWIKVLREAIDECTQNGKLPVVAFHNNDGFGVDHFRGGDPSTVEVIGPDFPETAGNFIVVTEPSDFRKITEVASNRRLKTVMPRSQRKEVAKEDDGSMSVAWDQKHYVNLEFRSGKLDVGAEMFDAVATALGWK